MAKKKAAGCDCFDQVDKALREHGCRLRQEMLMDFKSKKVRMAGPWVHVQKIDGSRKPVKSMICTYCPFCGKKINHG